MSSDQPLIVQALYAFKGTNNDELWFKKGDLITITQKEEGGWWEGTLGDKTGWFPTNFVKEVKDKDVIPTPITPVTQQKQYRAVVLKDLIDSEKAHVAELQGLVKTFLKPLEKSTILTIDEYRQLTGNITEVVETHLQLLELLEESETKPSDEQKVGKLFLTWAPKIKSVHQAYCSMHPKAVCILDLHKDELATYMESCGATTPGLLVLTTGLSKPFRRLDKYSGMLQELERHVEVNHPDRGDTQRSVAVYKDIAASCAALRRQKELELQVLTGPVRGWEGQSLAHLGDILHMGSVAVGPQHQDRYLVLFPDTLLVLSVSKRMSAFIYEGKLPLTGITITRLEDTDNYKNAFEITGHLIEKIVAICQSKDEANNWVDLLRRHTKGHHKTPPPVGGNAENVPPPPPHMSPMTTPSRLNPPTNNRSITSSTSPLHNLNVSPSPLHSTNTNNNGGWSATCIRPLPPHRLCLALGTAPRGNRRALSHSDDAQILKVIEAYCASNKPKHVINTVDSLGDGNVSPVHEKRRIVGQGQNPSGVVSGVLHRSNPLLMGPQRPHGAAPRASTWCCGSFVIRQIKKSQHLE